LYFFIAVNCVGKAAHGVSVGVDLILRLVLPVVVGALSNFTLDHQIAIAVMVELAFRFNLTIDLDEIVV
jgi:hypothetical protein